MIIGESLYSKMPEHLRELFVKLPNRGSDEVVAGFPVTTGSKATQRNMKPAGKQGKTYGLSDYANRYTSGEHYGDTGSAARFFYTAKASARERNAGLPEGMVNNHPTLKPLSLTEYLARLIVPPKSYRQEAKLLVPYSGSGSEMVGAVLAGWENVDGIEMGEDYIEIAKRRVAYWNKNDYSAPPLLAEL